MRICLVASSRFPLREPFAGGMESLTHALASDLVRRGHEITLFAAPGSDAGLSVIELAIPEFSPSAAARLDVFAPPQRWMAEHHAYLGLMLMLAQEGGDRFDVVHNHSLHHLPVALAPLLGVPMVTTLHTPPTPWLESALALSSAAGPFVAVSGTIKRAWSHVVESEVIGNGVDVSKWQLGSGGGPAVWSGRMVPEKAPHEAIDAARLAGVPLVLAGPAADPGYVAREVAPRIGPDVVLAGHLRQGELAALVGRASVALVTPAWEEPYGLVCAEAMSCGTPVAGYARGALPEVVAPVAGALADPGDVAGLARAIRVAMRKDRSAVRRHAVVHHSARRMVDQHEALYRRLSRDGVR